MLIVSVKPISGSTVTKDGELDAELECRIKATGIHHVTLPKLIEASPELLRALKQIQNNAAGRKWNSLSADRGDMDSWQFIEATAKAAIETVEGGAR